MSRWWTFRNSFLSILAAVAITTACANGDEYALRQPITMGPWTFQVERVTERIESRTSLRLKVVSVTLKLDNYMERHEKPFDDFMSGETRGLVTAPPHLMLVDEAGNRFYVEDLSPLSGGSLRSEGWNARFSLIQHSMRESASESAAEHFDKHPADFRLVIENPDHRSGQPHKVSIQLE